LGQVGLDEVGKDQWDMASEFPFPLRLRRWVLVLGFLILALGLANLGRAGVAIYYEARLPDLPMTVSWAYLAAIGGFWGVVFIVCAVGLMRFRPWGRWMTLIMVSLYEAHVWMNRLLFDASDYAFQTRPWDFMLTLLLLALIWGALSPRSIRRVFSRQAPHAMVVTANPKEREK